MDYNEDPDPPNREADEWRKGYLQIEADRNQLRARLSTLEAAAREMAAKLERFAFCKNASGMNPNWKCGECAGCGARVALESYRALAANPVSK